MPTSWKMVKSLMSWTSQSVGKKAIATCVYVRLKYAYHYLTFIDGRYILPVRVNGVAM